MIIGSSNLGDLFRDGKNRQILEEVGVGILMSLLLALIFDVIIVLIGRILLPWNREATSKRSVRKAAAVDPVTLNVRA